MSKPILDVDAILKRATPVTGQHAHEIQPFGHLVRMPIALSENACKESVENLNQLLADTMTLRDLYKNHHWQVAGPTFYQLHLLFDDRRVRAIGTHDQHVIDEHLRPFAHGVDDVRVGAIAIELGTRLDGRVLVAGVLSGLVWTCVASWPAAGADSARLPNFAPDDSTGWVPARGAGDEFLPPISGPGPVTSEKDHPYVPNREGQPTYRTTTGRAIEGSESETGRFAERRIMSG